jgi:Skp family chaperone for outer membrane proteins
MPDQKQMDKVKRQLERISYLMQRFENTAREEISSREDYLQVCGAMLAVVRNMYVEALGPVDAARMFEALANTFQYQDEILNMFQGVEENPTIH